MNKTVLFSPVGGTDPIAEKNMRDGSLLHICRVYKPDLVILYMSKEITAKHKQDNRYVLCLEKLAELQKRKMEYVIINREELERVENFDYFYGEFHNILSDVYSKLDESDTLLLNISSGTPAMKSGILVLRTLGEFQAKAIQVSTPEKKMNEHVHSEVYDLEELWELNEDNEEPFENRCREVSCPTLSDMVKKEIIKKHILVYDYRAAVDVAETLNGSEKEVLLGALKMALNRYLLKEDAVDKALKKGELHFQLPVRSNEHHRKCFEYALVCQLKLLRGEYADFIRSTTPLIMDLYEMILEVQFGIHAKRYCRQDSKGVYRWDREKMLGTEIDRILNDSYSPKRFDYNSMLNSDSLKRIIVKKASDETMIKLVEVTRSIENTLRNLAAHQMVSITDQNISKITGGYNGEQIMQSLRKLFDYTALDLKPDYWNSYDKMNDMLIQLLER